MVYSVVQPLTYCRYGMGKFLGESVLKRMEINVVAEPYVVVVVVVVVIVVVVVVVVVVLGGNRETIIAAVFSLPGQSRREHDKKKVKRTAIRVVDFYAFLKQARGSGSNDRLRNIPGILFVF